MDVILHIGAHRTASTSFQTYLRQNHAALAAHGTGFWGPLRLRKGVFHGVIPDPQLGIAKTAFLRAQGRLALQLARSGNQGLSQIIVSDENMLGLMRRNITSQTLYHDAGERIARYVAAFGGAVKMIHISIRCQSSYWPSALSFCIPRGICVPHAARIQAIATQPRDWRDVITDAAAAAPGVPIFVSTYEQFGGRPDALLRYLTDQSAPPRGKQIWRNQRPTVQSLMRLPLNAQDRARLSAGTRAGRWDPFTRPQRIALQERYADDLFWLRAGADGLAHFLEDPKPSKTGYPAQLGFVNKGQRYDTRQRLARPG